MTIYVIEFPFGHSQAPTCAFCTLIICSIEENLPEGTIKTKTVMVKPTLTITVWQTGNAVLQHGRAGLDLEIRDLEIRNFEICDPEFRDLEFPISSFFSSFCEISRIFRHLSEIVRDFSDQDFSMIRFPRMTRNS